jgi:tRNA A-37 threonylcarbamoyl transferase component Bud32
MADPAQPEAIGADALVGRLLAGQYRVDARIGAGAMGFVYRARHEMLHQDFAVKVLSRALSDDPEARRRFLAEAKVLTGIVHPAVVQVRHFGEEDGLVYLVMDLCSGETLQARLAREGALDARRAAGIAVRILEALEAAHARGVVHRDLKPANIMVSSSTEAGRDGVDDVRVLDFGLARILEPQDFTSAGLFASTRSDVTTEGKIVGTVAYMSPEQLHENASIDGRSDLFSVGVVLYEMLSGKRPFEGTSTISVALHILKEDPPPPRAPEALPAVAAPLRAVVARALAKDPDHRYPSAGAFAGALRAAVPGGSVLAPTAAAPRPHAPGRPRPAAPRRRRRRRGLLAGLALLVVAGAVGGALRWRHASEVSDVREAAHAALETGHLDRAVDGFGRLIADGDATGEDHLLRGEALTEMGDADAMLDLQHASDLLPGPRVWLAQAAALRVLPLQDKGPKLARMYDRLYAAQAAAGDLVDDVTVERARLQISLRDYLRALEDASRLEGRSPSDARAALLRGEVELTKAEEATEELRSLASGGEAPGGAKQEELEVRVRTAAERAQALAAEAARDPDLAEASLLAGLALGYLEAGARRRGDEPIWKRFARSSEKELAEAVRRAERRPAYHGQGRALARYYGVWARKRDSLRDHEGALEPARRALERHRTTHSFNLYTEELKSSGRYEEAIREYQSPWAATDPNAAFFVAFCHQMLGLRAATRGDVRAALAAYQSAVSEYTAVVDRKDRDGQSPEGELPYAAQTHVWRSLLFPAGPQREPDLDAAKALFGRIPTSTNFSVLERRSEYYTARGQHAAALEDIRRVVAGQQGLQLTAYRRFVRSLLDVAEELAAHPPGDALATALQAVQEAQALPSRQMPEQTEVHLLQAEALTRLARLAAGSPEGAQAAEAALANADLAEASLPEAGAEPGLVARLRAEIHHARAAAHLARGAVRDAHREARSAVDLREAEERARRWTPDPRWYDDLAEAARAAGHPEEAQRAGDRARQLRGS